MSRPAPTALEALGALLDLPGKVDALTERLDRLAAGGPGGAAPLPSPGPVAEYISFAAAAALVDVGHRTIAAWVKRGWLRRYGPRGAERVKVAELRELMAHRAERATDAVDFETKVRDLGRKLRR